MTLIKMEHASSYVHFWMDISASTSQNLPFHSLVLYIFQFHFEVLAMSAAIWNFMRLAGTNASTT